MNILTKMENEIKTIFDKSDNIWGVNNPPPILLPSGDWSEWLPTFEPQSFLGLDSNECSQLSAVNALDTFLNWLLKTGQMTPKCATFFQQYLDSNGLIASSEDFTGILDGTSINGNIAQNAWKCFQKYGILPRSQLNWSAALAAQYPDQASMDAAYYSPTRVTQAMLDLAQASKQYINMSWGWIVNGTTNAGIEPLSNGLKTSPLQYVIPIPSPVNEWNQVEIPYLEGTTLQHCVTGYKIDQTGIAFPYFITDQYEPWLKQLQSTYYISIAIAFVVNMLQ